MYKCSLFLSAGMVSGSHGLWTFWRVYFWHYALLSTKMSWFNKVIGYFLCALESSRKLMVRYFYLLLYIFVLSVLLKVSYHPLVLRDFSCLESCLERQETGLVRQESCLTRWVKNGKAVDVKNLREVMFGSEVHVWICLTLHWTDYQW